MFRFPLSLSFSSPLPPSRLIIIASPSIYLRPPSSHYQPLPLSFLSIIVSPLSIYLRLPLPIYQPPPFSLPYQFIASPLSIYPRSLFPFITLSPYPSNLVPLFPFINPLPLSISPYQLSCPPYPSIFVPLFPFINPLPYPSLLLFSPIQLSCPPYPSIFVSLFPFINPLPFPSRLINYRVPLIHLPRPLFPFINPLPFSSRLINYRVPLIHLSSSPSSHLSTPSPSLLSLSIIASPLSIYPRLPLPIYQPPPLPFSPYQLSRPPYPSIFVSLFPFINPLPLSISPSLLSLSIIASPLSIYLRLPLPIYQPPPLLFSPYQLSRPPYPSIFVSLFPFINPLPLSISLSLLASSIIASPLSIYLRPPLPIYQPPPLIHLSLSIIRPLIHLPSSPSSHLSTPIPLSISLINYRVPLSIYLPPPSTPCRPPTPVGPGAPPLPSPSGAEIYASVPCPLPLGAAPLPLGPSLEKKGSFLRRPCNPAPSPKTPPPSPPPPPQNPPPFDPS
ncbi:hypothetical protein C7M84_015006 [Penaeus vannamei]|uniref:Uncharacterized protein n=1 Tax=Penaeus vannamei TaxID=6689 RepID=A0A423SRR0_PENVA|nr:hypothetical protein C7M84_015006 [Penaeus vannamei]